MSWKNVRPSSPGLSITARLILLFTAAAVVILSMSMGMLYRGLSKSLEERSSHYLRDEVNILRAMLARADGLQEVKREIRMESGTLEYVAHYVRVVDKSGRVLLETPDMDRLIPVSAFPKPTGEEKRYGERAEWTTAEGQTFMLKALHTGGEDVPDRYLLHVALNATRKDAILDEYRRELFHVGLFGILASLAAAVFITRRGLSPLRKITSATQRVSATHLDERLQAHHWPRELHDLAGSYDRMLDRLQDSFDRLSQFASNMAHEFRTPLGNLMGEAEVALTRDRSGEEYRALVESSLEEYRRLARIVESLLFLARAENGAHPLNLSTLALREELEEISEYYRPIAEEKGIELEIDGSHHIRVDADSNLFRRAVGNLILNAIRYTPIDGKVTLFCSQGEAGGVDVKVADTGCGIAEDNLPRLFDRFYRVEVARSGRPQGFGLGLSIVKSIMDLHGGAVTLRSQVDVGTIVTLHFPSTPNGSGN
jgi:two-component system heavy metal sensor histidine kinase CusS